MELMSPKNDFVFKRIFGSEENKDILLNFLNAALQFSNHQKLTDVEILSPNLEKRHLEDKMSVLDIRARTADGVQINIEIQVLNEANMEKRTLYYWSRLFTEQLPEGSKYTDLKRTITINILDFVYFKQFSKYHSVFYLLEEETQVKLTGLLEIHFIELRKVELENLRTDDPLVKWLLFLKGVSYAGLEAYGMTDPTLRKAINVLEILSKDKEARMLYEMRQKALRDKAWYLDGAKTRATQGNICSILQAKFGDASHSIQEVIQQITESSVLDRLIVGVAMVNTLDEAERVLQEVLKETNG